MRSVHCGPLGVGITVGVHRQKVYFFPVKELANYFFWVSLSPTCFSFADSVLAISGASKSSLT